MHPDETELSDLCQKWQPPIEPDSRFQHRVWSRIRVTEERADSATAPLFAWIRFLASPRVALFTCAVAVCGGMLLGGIQAQTIQKERYLLSLNPWAALQPHP